MSATNMVAYVDEAGEKGLVRNLMPHRDSKVALLSALLFPLPEIDQFRAVFEPLFTRFKNEGGARFEKVHIAAAYQPGNEDLRPMADEVRAGIFQQLSDKRVPIIYAARRLRVLREGYEATQKAIAHAEQISAQARAGRPKRIEIPKRPSDERIEQDLVSSLTLLLDAYADDFGITQIDLATDQMDLPIAAGLTERMSAMRSISFSQTVVKTYDLTVHQPSQRTITFKVNDSPFPLDVKHLCELIVVGKDDPLVFAADAVVNALNDHLLSLPADAPVNATSSIQNWTLQNRVWGARIAVEETLPAIW